MVKIILLSIVSTGLLFGCKNKAPKQVKTPRDTTINITNSFSELFLDSSAVEKYIVEHETGDSTSDRLRNFYNSRNYAFAWFVNDGLAEQGRAFWNLHNSYLNISQDSSFVDKALHDQMDALVNEDTTIHPTSAEVTKLELQLTEHFFQYAQYAYAGKIDPSELQWHIPRKKIDVVSLLDSLVSTKGKKIDEWEPVSRQYKLMKEILIRYYEIEKNNEWKPIASTKSKLKQGDSSLMVTQVKHRLRSSGDFNENDSSAMFTEALKKAVMLAQKRFGFNQTGVIDVALIKELNVSIHHRITQLLVNMERMRWMPAAPGGNRLVANIPEFKLHVYENGKEAFKMNVVVGTAANKTVVFNDQLKHIVFSPYWNIPRSIVRNEILPGMNRSSNYLSRRNMERTGYSNGLPVIRQKPGGSNALGRVKFLFPNSYAIYFHDTPSKSLFSKESRAFSHGCIRLAEPQKLAEYLLRNKPEWTSNTIQKAMFAGKEKWVTLSETIPVFISYFTAWVDDEGLLNFRDDIYGHDKKMAVQLFQ